MQARSLSFGLFALVGLALLAGCSPPTGTVTGEVTVNGVPLVEGEIVFIPADNNGVRVAKKITAGKYEATMVAGKKIVQISAPVVIAKHKESSHPDARLVEQTDESLPARYNRESELTFEVQPGSTTKNWGLESDRKP
jgi:hypothetical protein